MGALYFALGVLFVELLHLIKQAQCFAKHNQVQPACWREQGFEIRHSPQAQISPRLGDGRNTLRRRIPRCRQKPGQGLGQVGPANGERPQRIEQPARNLGEHAVVDCRHDLGEGDAAGVAKAAAFARRHAVHYGHGIAFALQESRRGHAPRCRLR